MVDPPDEPLVAMDEMEASILDFLMVISEIVASSANFSRFFLFHYFRSGQPLCRVVELLLLPLYASRALRISSQWGLTESLNFFSQGICHEIATRCCHKRPGLELPPILFPVTTLQMPLVRCQRLWTATESEYLVVPPYNFGVSAETIPWDKWDNGSIQCFWPSVRWSQQSQRCVLESVGINSS